jgi:glycine/D-amino acid oxidase-like deaminating enzyme
MAGQLDAVIVGRGLAGAVLTETLRQRGLQVRVYDVKRPGNASMAAAGVVNPVVLRRDVPSWRARELLPLAQRFYRGWSERAGWHGWHELPLVKLFPTPKEADQWIRAMQNEAGRSLLDLLPEPELEQAGIPHPNGHGTVPRCAWLNVPVMLEAQRAVLLAEGVLVERMLQPGEVRTTAHGVVVDDARARWLIRCEGPFATVPGMVPVKGETVVVHIPGVRLSRMVHRGVFLLPLGGERYRVGATFAWDDVFSGPSEEAKRWLLERLASFMPRPFTVEDHQAGVRPTARDRRPLLGVVGAGEAVLNGLGSRGALLAPWCAAHLADHLFNGAPLDAEVAWDRPGLAVNA